MKKQFFAFSVLLLTSVVPVGVFARDSSPEVSRGEAPKPGSALEEWKAAVEGGDAEAIVALYDKDAIMISTFVQNPITSRKELLGYFKKVVANPDVRVEIEDEHPRRFGDTAVNTGRYVLSYTQEGEEVSVPARFSFTYRLQGGKGAKRWVIVDQHSSAVPLPQEPK